jgi:hypothetical protein
MSAAPIRLLITHLLHATTYMIGVDRKNHAPRATIVPLPVESLLT